MNRWKGIPFAMNYIALNDNPEDTDIESVCGYISTNTIAHCTGNDPMELAIGIVSIRLKIRKEKQK